MSRAERAPMPKMTGSRSLTSVGAPLVVLVLVVLAVIPFARGWRAREARIDAAQTQLAEIAGVVRGQGTLDSLATQRERELALRPQRVLRSRTRALAASALQSLVQEMADASNVTVTRLDVANVENRGDLPITLSANGDIFGLAELLRQIRAARYTVVVDKLQTQNNSALRGAPDVLQISLSLHAPVIVQ